MGDRKPFVGRAEELRRWDEVLASPRGEAVLVVGQQGMGKTMLVNKMAELATDHPDWKCGAVRYEVAPTDHPDGTMGLMLEHAFEAAQAVARSFDRTPQRRSQWEALIRAILPKGGDLVELVNSLRPDPQRHTRDQFLDRLDLISRRMPAHGRAVFVLDPEKYMPEGSADTWRLVVAALPEKIKLVFAQRNDGCLVANRDFMALPNVVRIPQGDLDVLGEDAVERLIELSTPRIAHSPGALRRAIAVYNRHPYAVPAALQLLADGADIAALPGDPTPEGVARQQWQRVCTRGAEAICLFRAYAVLEVAVPREVAWAVADLNSQTYDYLLADDYVAGLLRTETEGRRIYHSLLADHIKASLSECDARPLHMRAVQAYRGRLNAESRRDALAATRLPEHVLAAEGEQAFVACVVHECHPALRRLGLLETCLAFLDRALGIVESGSAEQAVVLGNLGLIYQTRSDLDRAEHMHRKSLEIEEKLGRLEGMAINYGNLGGVYQTRGDLDRAEQMLRKALEINEKLGRLEGMACQYGNLGVIYQTRGDLDRAEQMYRKSLEINEKLGRLEGMANEYGNLGLIYRTRGDLDRAEEMHRKALEINEKLGRLEGMANEYGNLGLIYRTRGDLDRAEEMHRKALEINEKLGRLEGMASDYGNLGLIYRTRGDLDRAEQMHRKALEIFENLGGLGGMASQYGNLGLIYLTRGDLDRAEEMLRKSLEIDERLGRLEGMANQYGNLGSVAEQRGDTVRARELWRKSRELFERIGMPHRVQRVQDWLDRLRKEPGA